MLCDLAGNKARRLEFHILDSLHYEGIVFDF